MDAPYDQMTTNPNLIQMHCRELHGCPLRSDDYKSESDTNALPGTSWMPLYDQMTTNPNLTQMR